MRHRALTAALRGEVPVFVLADEQEQIESAVLWATGRGLRPVVAGGHDAAACSQLLLERRVPVNVDGTHRLPAREDSQYDDPFTLPAHLAMAGVQFCITTGAAFGLEPQQALAAITKDAAEILGLGDPFELTTKGTMAFVRGREVDLRYKQTELAKKYREKYRQADQGEKK